jgi:hypothetical protein
MRYRKYGALVASFSVVAMMLAPGVSSAQSGVVARGPLVARHAPFSPAFRHHQFRNHQFRNHQKFPGAVFWPGDGFYGDSFYGDSTNSAPLASVPQPVSEGVNYTYKYDVPWDWAHRFPPMVAPSDRPYVSSCPSETVTVPGSDGDQTVNIIRCY